MVYLRVSTVIWGLLGTGSALLMINAKSALDIWWQFSGIFGGGILGLFLLSLMRIRLQLWQGMISIGVSILVVTWGTFARDLPRAWQWAQCDLDRIIIGAAGTAVLIPVACLFGLSNRTLAKRKDQIAGLEEDNKDGLSDKHL